MYGTQFLYDMYTEHNTYTEKNSNERYRLLEVYVFYWKKISFIGSVYRSLEVYVV